MKMNINVSFNLAPSFLVAVTRHAQSTQNGKFAISLHYLKKRERDEFDFCADRHNRFLQIDTVIFLIVVRHIENTENHKYAISLQYLRKEMSKEVYFLHADKH